VDPPRTKKAIAEMFCPAVLSTTLGVKQAQAAMTKRHAKVVAIDKLMVTNLKEIPPQLGEFMASHGVRIVGVDDDRLSVKARETFEGKQLVNVLKLGAVTHPDWGYGAIQLADWDVFMLHPTDLLTRAASKGKITILPGSMTPTNGGLLVVRPSTKLGDSLVRALDHGFSIEHGWGGKYSRRDLLLARPYVDKFCKKGAVEGEHECCKSVPRSMWCFGAASVDQGLLFHLMIDGGRKSNCPPFGESCEFVSNQLFHVTLSPKPWQMGDVWYWQNHGKLKLPTSDSMEHYNSRLDDWWEEVGDPWANQIFRKDKSCRALFDEQRELHRQWQNGRKPVMWVHVHKNAGTSMCHLAKGKERVVEPSDGTCNSRDLHDTFYPDGLGQKRQWTTCEERAKYFFRGRFTWGQLERELNPGDYCKDDFIYGITLRHPIARIESYANWNSKAVKGEQWKDFMICIQAKDASECPAFDGSAVSQANRGYQLWDNLNIRVLLGYDVFKLPPGGVNTSHLSEAIRLLKQFDLVLTLEGFSSELAQQKMRKVLGWAGTRHERGNSHRTVEFTKAQRSAWARLNHLDIQLYFHFAQQYEED